MEPSRMKSPIDTRRPFHCLLLSLALWQVSCAAVRKQSGIAIDPATRLAAQSPNVTTEARSQTGAVAADTAAGLRAGSQRHRRGN